MKYLGLASGSCEPLSSHYDLFEFQPTIPDIYLKEPEEDLQVTTFVLEKFQIVITNAN
jgi:hypothetical protein